MSQSEKDLIKIKYDRSNRCKCKWQRVRPWQRRASNQDELYRNFQRIFRVSFVLELYRSFRKTTPQIIRPDTYHSIDRSFFSIWKFRRQWSDKKRVRSHFHESISLAEGCRSPSAGLFAAAPLMRRSRTIYSLTYISQLCSSEKALLLVRVSTHAIFFLSLSLKLL